jgi:hypothetical protein
LSYWAVARTEPNREALARSELGRRGYEVYCPHISEKTVRRGRTVVVIKSLFVNYLFLVIDTQFYNAMWCPGVSTLLLDGERPAQVPVAVIDDLRSRERNGLITLPRPPRFQPGEPVRVTRGLFIGRLGLYEGQRSQERIAILLASLGRIELAAGDVAAVG